LPRWSEPRGRAQSTSPEFTGDPDRIRRFEQEAKAASALNQPNILTILSTVWRDWSLAEAWLYRELNDRSAA
jgi:hypothetical protein